MKPPSIRSVLIAAALILAILFGCFGCLLEPFSSVELNQKINYGQAVLHVPENAVTLEKNHGTTKAIALNNDIGIGISPLENSFDNVIDQGEAENTKTALELLDNLDASLGTPSFKTNKEFNKITIPVSNYSSAAGNNETASTCNGYVIFLCQENQSYLILVCAASDSYDKLKPTIDAIADSATIDSSLDTVTVKTIESIEATYGGSDKAGTVIDSNSDITVTAVYDDGSTEDVEGWTIESPQTLEAGKTAEVEILYNNISASLYVKCVKLKSIKASYSGSTKAGTTIDSDSDITLTAVYDDDSTEEITNWTIKSPKTLKAGKTAKVKISYDGGSTTLSVKCTSKTKAQQKSEYKAKCKTVGYKSVARNPEKYEGDKIKISGEVLQVTEGDYGINSLRVATSGGYDNVYLVSYDSDELSQNILEDDRVTIWGECTGTTSYTTVLGATITIPSMDAKYFSIS